MLPPRQFEQLNSHRCGDGVSSSSDWAMGQILKILTLPETATQFDCRKYMSSLYEYCWWRIRTGDGSELLDESPFINLT